METVTIHIAKTTLSKLIARAEAGEEVFIARGKTQVVKLVPVKPPKKKSIIGALKGKISLDDSFFDPLPDDELEAWGQ